MTQNKNSVLFLVIRPTDTVYTKTSSAGATMVEKKREEMVVNAFKTYSEVPTDIKTSKSLRVRRTEMTPVQAYQTMFRLGKVR